MFYNVTLLCKHCNDSYVIIKTNIHNLFVPQDKSNVGVIYTRKTERREDCGGKKVEKTK
jgi:hypothetical protein